MKKYLFSLAATLFVIRQDGTPMTITNVPAQEIESAGYQVVSKAAYDDAVASLPKPVIIDQGPSLEDRLSAVEAHQADQDAAISAIVTKTGTVVSPDSQVTP